MLYLISLVLPVCIAIGFTYGGVLTFTTTAFYIAFEVVTFLIGFRPLQPTKKHSWFYTAVLLLNAAAYFAVLIYGATQMSQRVLWEQIVLTYFVGYHGGSTAAVTAHELIHRADRLQRWCGFAILTAFNWAHYGIHHLVIHHAYSGTAKDPAAPKLGESCYGFFVRAAQAYVRGAIAFEADRLRKRQRSPYSVRNRMWWTTLPFFFVCLVFHQLWSFEGLGLLLGQASIATFALVVGDYVQHYGLVRKETQAGRYDREDENYSWSSGYPLVCAQLLNITSHADHHSHPTRHYQQLRYIEGTPLLPTSQSISVAAAMIPPLWRKMMDPRVAALKQRASTTLDRAG